MSSITRYGFFTGTIIQENDEVERKDRRIVIVKPEIYRDIDSHTYKYVEGRAAEATAEGNAVASDVTENLDGSVINRLMDYRDAALRKFMSHSLADKVEVRHETDIQQIEGEYVYCLSLPVDFKDALLRSLAIYIHWYIVWGVLYDWYLQFGNAQQASVYKGELDEMEQQINDLLRTPSRAKRPMQPFGPAKRFRNL